MFPRRLLTSTRGARVVEGNGFAKIVAEQTKRADDYDNDREKLQDARDNLGRTHAHALRPRRSCRLLPSCSSSGSCSAESAAPATTASTSRSLRRTRRPAIVPPLLRQGTYPGSLEFTATLFDLIRRGYYVAKPVTTEKKTWAGLRYGAGRRSRAVAGRRVGRVGDVRGAGRQGLRPHRRRRPRGPVEDARPHRGDAHLEQQALRALQGGRLQGDRQAPLVRRHAARRPSDSSSLPWSSPPSCCSGKASPASGP